MTADESAKRFMIWWEKHTCELQGTALDQFFVKNWERAIKQTCDKYKVERADLFSALIDLL